MSEPIRRRLQRRAEFFAAIRAFFASRGVLEVDTPLLATCTATDPFLDSFLVTSRHDPCDRYLLTSPEHAMKRLLAAGSGPIFQLNRAFRDGEFGDRHNPEFQMLEWYRPGFSLTQLRQEVSDLLKHLGFNLPVDQITYRELFREILAVDPFLAAESALAAVALDHIGPLPEGLDRDGLLDLLMSHVVEPALGKRGGVMFVCDYPASQAALAVVRKDDDGVPVASRFELYLSGVEIANAYEELADARELARRFDQDNLRRKGMGKPVIPVDRRLLGVLDQMPPCSGVALGADRLFWLAEGGTPLGGTPLGGTPLGGTPLGDSLPFPWDTI